MHCRSPGPLTINSEGTWLNFTMFTFLHSLNFLLLPFKFLILHFAGFTQRVSQLPPQASCATSYFRHHNPELNSLTKLTFPKNRNLMNHTPISSSHILPKQNSRQSLIPSLHTLHCFNKSAPRTAKIIMVPNTPWILSDQLKDFTT